MDRYAMFIDVGYVLAAVAELLTGSPDRSRIDADYAGLVQALTGQTTQSRLPEARLLRVYWYDATPAGSVTAEQAAIAELPNVKLRLGRLVPRGEVLEQKGVDSRIVRDLIVLAHDRAVSTAFLLAGDEDLVEGVVEAQERGVRVVGLGVPGQNRARRLVQELDEADILPEEFWKSCIRERPLPVPVPAATASSGVAGRGRLAEPAALRPATAGMMQAGASFTPFRDAFAAAGVESEAAAKMDMAYREAARDAGRTFARNLAQMASPPEIERLLTGHEPGSWRVPPEFDRQLLKAADDELGFLWEQPRLKADVRAGFWEVLEARDAPGTGEGAGDPTLTNSAAPAREG